MKAILIFDNVNDLVFFKWDDNFIQRMKMLNIQVSEIYIVCFYLIKNI